MAERLSSILQLDTGVRFPSGAIVTKTNKDKIMAPLLLGIIAGVISNVLSDYITRKYQRTTPVTINNITNINYYGDVQNIYIDRVEK